jgi:hypothetical protein
MNHPDASVIEREWLPGQLIRMVAGQLAAYGFDVQGHESDDDDRLLTINGLPGMRCLLQIEDCGGFECEYVPRPGWETDPARVAGLVANRLSSEGIQCHGIAERPTVPGFPPRTFIGTELKAAGLDVDLDVYPDLVSFKVIADLVVRNPDHPERGEIRISDNGGIILECDCCEAGASAAMIEAVAESLASDIRHTIAKFNAAVSLPPAPGKE